MSYLSCGIGGLSNARPEPERISVRGREAWYGARMRSLLEVEIVEIRGC